MIFRRFFQFPAKFPNSIFCSQTSYTKSKKNDVINIRAIKGDDFVKEAQTGQVDIIKIDTEGSDFEVLQGFIKVIKKDKPFVQFELSKWLHIKFYAPCSFDEASFGAVGYGGFLCQKLA